MFGGRGKRLYVRTRISRLEQGLSWAILGVLAGLGTAIYWSGQTGTPEALVLPGPAALEPPRGVTGAVAAQRRQEPTAPTTAAGPGSALTPPTPDRTTADPQPAGMGAVQSGEGLLAGLAVPGWLAAEPLQQFTAANLYEKIDGRAEQYLAFDVQALFCQQFTGLDGASIEIFAYDMGDPLRAFGVYAAERAPEHAPAKLGREGYLASGSFLFWQDRWYLQVLASDQAEPVQQAALALARLLAARLGDQGPDLWGLALLPEQDRIPRSEEYLQRDALGLEFLTDSFVARYRLAGNELTAFISRQPTAEAAAGVLASYQAYLRDYGSGISTREIGKTAATLGDLSGSYDLVFQSGVFVAGVSMAPDPATAESLATDLVQSLASR